MAKHTNLKDFAEIDGRLIYKGYMAYYLSNSWKCDKSPTKAHWWVGVDGIFTCKYCGKSEPIIKDIRRKRKNADGNGRMD